ncbi:unnamed protein product [Parascedosporium putredinis]|uniref:Galactokinase n=1 Tax=Parascedosporium putredinis TaxID=1442378 RepID=A0A9P1M826_9PEZI|nr:unnamed protein product [Parascedosporium putredinis]CAI7989356.1 unnamed protein product [Parascedosporium putredinis]
MAMAGCVPNSKSLSEIYYPGELGGQEKRWNSLISSFKTRYGCRPDFVARSPGRVNIIGEHIDYSLYPVLPMAISADTIIAVSSTHTDAASSSFEVEIANLEDDKFSAGTFSVPIGGDVDIDAKVHDWVNYFKAGLRGAFDPLQKRKGRAGVLAAFTTASALAVMLANGEETIDKTELTELAIVSERAVGVNSGGMDQSASVFSNRGSAVHVEFVPSLKATPVSFPETSPQLTFLIAQSYVTSEKQVTGPIHYNLRVAECSLAAAYLNAVTNAPGTTLPADNSPLGISLSTFGATQKTTPQDLDALIRLVEEKLPKTEGYTREEIAHVLGITVADLEARFTTKFPVRASHFMLRQRALHVFSEARRVQRFTELLAASSAEGAGPAPATLSLDLGALLNETQDSCRDLYDCSCPEIDLICAIALEAGAYGSRLTGAGWGGCTVHLIPADKVDAVQTALKKQYYEAKGITIGEDTMVVSKPGSGSSFVWASDLEGI